MKRYKIIQKETISLLEAMIELSLPKKLENNSGIRIQKQYSLENLGTDYCIDAMVNGKIKTIPLFVEDK